MNDYNGRNGNGYQPLPKVRWPPDVGTNDAFDSQIPQPPPKVRWPPDVGTNDAFDLRTHQPLPNDIQPTYRPPPRLSNENTSKPLWYLAGCLWSVFWLGLAVGVVIGENI